MWYAGFLWLHNWNRWLLLVTTAWVVVSSAVARRRGSPYPAPYPVSAGISLVLTSVQSILGFGLFVVFGSYLKPLFQAPGTFFRTEELRFFGLEHVAAMITAVGLVHFGVARARRSADYSWLLWSHGAALLLYCLAIPWWRPLLR